MDLFRPTRLVDALTVICYAAIQIYFIWKYGITSWETNDGVGYVQLAEQLKTSAVWTAVPELSYSYLPLSLLRLPGFPLLIALLQSVAGGYWLQTLVAIQLTLAMVAAYTLYRTVLVVSSARIVAFGTGLIFLISPRAEFDRWVLTDSIYISLATMLICLAAWLVYVRREVTTPQLALTSAALVVLFLFREMTIVLALAALPLAALALWIPAAGAARLIKRVTALFAPLLLAVVTVLTWNLYRTGQAVITTGAQTAAIWSLSQVEKEGTPIFTGDGPLDQIARKHLRDYSFDETTYINRDLHLVHGWTAPQIARAATQRYLQAWHEHPSVMLQKMLGNYVFWRFMFVSSDAALWLQSLSCSSFPYLSQEVPCNGYVNAMRGLFEWCVTVLPGAWLGAALIFRAARRQFLLVASLLFLTIVSAAVYSAIHFEMRYLLFSASALLLIAGLSVGAIIRGGARTLDWLIPLAAQVRSRPVTAEACVPGRPVC